MSLANNIIIDGERYLPITRAARLLGMDRNTLYAETKNKPFYGMNRKLYLGAIVCFKESEVEQAIYKKILGNRYAVKE